MNININIFYFLLRERLTQDPPHCKRLKRKKNRRNFPKFTHISHKQIPKISHNKYFSKEQLNKRGGEIIGQIGTLNKCIAGRTSKEYYKDDKDKLKGK